MSDLISELCRTFKALKKLEKEMGLEPQYVIAVSLFDFNLMYTEWINEGMAFGL